MVSAKGRADHGRMIPTRQSPVRTILALAAFGLLAIPSVAAAQSPSSADSVKVSLWPEYDRSEVLVIYRVDLPEGTELPTRVRLLVPPDTPDLTAAAVRAPSGELVNAPFTKVDGELADVVEVEADGSEVQIEFYLPLEVTGDLRRFSFIWPGGLATAAFAFEVQQPAGAADIRVEPAATSRSTDSLGLTYHLVDLADQTAFEQPEVSFSYSKTTEQLSADVLAPPGGLAPPARASGATVDIRSLLPWILLLAGVGLIAAGVVYFLRTRSDERPARPRHRGSKATPASNDRVDASPVFCHNCGAQATASDRFCRQCGTALRV
jgi:hypothetical protein